MEDIMQGLANIRFLCIANLFIGLAALMVAIGNRHDKKNGKSD